MEITLHALFTGIHGMLFGLFFLMAIYGVIVELCRSTYVEQPSPLTSKGYRRERLYLICLAGLGWAAVLSGAYVVYPWYRAIPPAGVTNLAQYPQFFLKSSTTTARWHTLGMEWKEHIAWMAPIVMTMVAYVLTKYRGDIKDNRQVRAAVLAFALIAFLAAGIAGGFGALIDKTAPVEGGPTINLVRGTK